VLLEWYTDSYLNYIYMYSYLNGAYFLIWVVYSFLFEWYTNSYFNCRGLPLTLCKHFNVYYYIIWNNININVILQHENHWIPF
jgi:hypothetical protein